jgi:ribonucleoside-triphosphate reductase (thioredoxin)
VNKSNKLLSDIVAFRTYAKYLQHLARRESLEESINRNMNMHLEKFPKLSRDIIKAYKQVHDLKVMPSMRSLQFGGDAIQKNNSRIYNCAFVHIKYPRVFAESLYLLLCGTGVGYSVQNHHIEQLPNLRKPKRENGHSIHDSIEGWADAVDALMNAYFYGAIRPLFDYSQISPKGAYLATTGSKAPGPEPLRVALNLVEKKLQGAIGRKLTSLEVHDIICVLADCVLAGGIRRAALISLFDKNDQAMLTCKHGEWWTKTPYRARANNSAMLLRSETTYDEFLSVFQACIDSNAGEPGFLWVDDLEMGANPCVEIGLQSNQFCNLTTTNMTGIKSEKDFLNRIYAATLLGTLQASYTDFPYLGEKWKQVTESEALIGCSFTGIADSPAVTPELLQKAAALVLEVNEKYSKLIGINKAARTTAIKPEGTASCVLGSASGIHARHAPYYLRRIRLNKEESLAKYLKLAIPELVEDDLFSSRDSVVTIPQQSPEESIVRDQESASSLLDRVLFYNKNWVIPGHRSGKARHNVSCTINYKPDEISGLLTRLWDQRHVYSGISLLPFDGGNYQQAPFETCDETKFQTINKLVKDIDLTKVMEIDDQTNMAEQLACAGGVCEIR